MRTFDAEAAATAMELQRRLIDFGREADFNAARDITDFYAEDGALVAWATPALSVGIRLYGSSTQIAISALRASKRTAFGRYVIHLRMCRS
jgi:hypothetical protein